MWNNKIYRCGLFFVLCTWEIIIYFGEGAGDNCFAHSTKFHLFDSVLPHTPQNNNSI